MKLANKHWIDMTLYDQFHTFVVLNKIQYNYIDALQNEIQSEKVISRHLVKDVSTAGLWDRVYIYSVK